MVRVSFAENMSADGCVHVIRKWLSYLNGGGGEV